MQYDLEHLQFVARNYSKLRSLPWAVVGITFLALGLLQWNGYVLTEFRHKVTFLCVAGPICVCSFVLARRFYRSRFGTTAFSPFPLPESVRWLIMPAFFVYVILHVFIVPAYFPKLIDPFLLLIGFLLIIAEFQKGFLVHRIIAGLLLAGVSVAPMFHWVPTEQFDRALGSIMIGAALLLIGIADYWVLVRSLPRVETGESHG